MLFFCWLIPVWSSIEYVCCVCDPSVCLSVPSICQNCVCMRDVISEFNSAIEGSLAFCALMLFLCSILCVLEVVCMWCVSCLLECCGD